MLAGFATLVDLQRGEESSVSVAQPAAGRNQIRTSLERALERHRSSPLLDLAMVARSEDLRD